MKKEGIVRLITRILLYQELAGYNIFRQVLSKGVKVRPNYLYMILTGMRSNGLLSARWIESSKGGPKRHLYSLSQKGKEQFRNMVNDSLTIMMDAYVQANLRARDVQDHANGLRTSLELSGVPYPRGADKFVIATPPFDPLICLPLGFRIISEIFPSTSLIVVKPQGINFYDERPNITFVDGQRHDMPLKDGFADYLMLEGFPKEATARSTIRECARVLKKDGHFILRFPIIMTEERRPKWTNFAEFAMNQYYEVFESDRGVSREEVKTLVSEYFDTHGEVERGVNVIIHATGKDESSIKKAELITVRR
jgi:DNA-binding PadR family transcriptional regulator